MKEPKPDEGRLPSYDEFVKEYGKRPADITFNMAVRLTASILEAYYNEVMRIAVLSREAGVTQIKEAECQQRVEGIFEEIEGYSIPRRYSNRPFELFRINTEKWQALKKEEGV